MDEIAAIGSTLGGLASLAVGAAPTSLGNLTLEGVCSALNEFSECVRYLNTRRSAGAVLSLSSEADVQDALYLILRPWVRDLVPESPTDKVGNRYSIRDFVSRSLRFVLETKYVRDADHGRTVSRELHDDIEVYRHHPLCDTVVFFIYDPDSLIPDQSELRRTIEQSRVYDGRPLRCCLIVKP